MLNPMVDEGLNPGEVKVEPGTARGNGTAGTPAVVGVDVLAVRAIGGAPELNSAQRGHFRFVSVGGEEGQKCPRRTIDREERGNLLIWPICPQCPHRLCVSDKPLSQHGRQEWK